MAVVSATSAWFWLELAHPAGGFVGGWATVLTIASATYLLRGPPEKTLRWFVVLVLPCCATLSVNLAILEWPE
jgi:hypothetical protein